MIGRKMAVRAKKFFGLSFMGAITAVLVGIVAWGEVMAQGESPIRIGWQPAEEMRFYAAKELGLFEKEGLSPKYSYFAAGPPMFSAFESNSIDVGYMWLAPVVIGFAQGIEWKIIMIDGDGPKTEGLVVRKDAGINTGNDLRGKTVAITKGTSAYYAFAKVLEKFRIKESDVKVMHLLPVAMIPAFEKKDIDAVYIWEPWLSKLAERNGKVLFTDADVDVPGTGVWLARKEFIEKHPETLQRFLRALDKATDHLKTDPTPAVKEMATRMDIKEEVAKQIYEKTYLPPYEQQVDPKYGLGLYPDTHLGSTLSDMGKFLKATGRIDKVPDVNVMFDRGPIEQYLKKRK
ncbi:MAG: aliphatic sulfonate ABC transporter substrate-binding protein [Burkholderiales bacterium]|nr:aliphatic sulfonate ABC transporter substrate-binding protein [Burkholderiales bacterium]